MKKLVLVIIFLLSFSSACFAVSREDALSAIENAKGIIEEMKSLGFKVTYANDTLREAELMLKAGNYLAAKSLAEYVNIIKNKAIEVDKLIDEVEERMYEAEKKGLDVSDLETILEKGIGYFEKENYDEAKKLLLKCLDGIEEKEKEVIVSRISLRNEIKILMNFLKKNYPYIISVGIVFLTIFSISYRRLKIQLLKKKLRRLKKEKTVIEKLLKDLQKKYFVKKIISEKEYKTISKKHLKRLAKIKKDIKVLESILKG